ncbi:MAG: alkaline phosphatase family protein [Acidobacteriota bacterium]|nr:alkaline phosphatase family protein [Blastocatellia bacterium]MDW8240379.1 alkaline phosphatase family protein [Acidobacteriota bacterium]
MNKTLIIGLDGVGFDGLRRLVAERQCPTLGRLMQNGACCQLESTFPPITTVAWTSLATGKNPGKHGIFEFMVSRRGDRQPMLANATARDGEAIWEIAHRAGLRVIVTNFPCTYPPVALNGVMIADFMTPRGRRDFVSPPELLNEIETNLGPYRLYLTQTYARGQVDAVIDELIAEAQYKSRVNRYLMRRFQWDLFITHLWGTDRIQHELWHITDPAHPRHDVVESRHYRPKILAYWQEVDRQIDRMIQEAGPGTSVWIVSDHGFGPIHWYCSFNLWLLQQGFLTLKTDALSRIKWALFQLGITPELAYRASRHWLFHRIRPPRGMSLDPRSVGWLSRCFLSFSDVDWKRTTVYSKGNYGQMFVNLRGREPHGIVAPGREYEDVRERLIARLRDVVDPVSGQRLIGPIWKREELYAGPHVEHAPDICFLPHDMRYLALGNTDFTSRRFITGAFGNSGGHRLHGVLLAQGEHIRSGVELGQAKIYDVLPSLLYSMGLSIPTDIDGQLIAELFEPQYLCAHPPRYQQAVSSQAQRQSVEFTPEEQAEVEARLRSLGYLA